jgi:hypothetical protein|tara:strand:- start:7755 stop:8840 length:1086 start_codon:yes stop_codon:yes gene_type:complete
MNGIVFKCPINSVSFGNVSINLLREMFNRDMTVSLFPIGNPDVSVYDKLNKDFREWLQSSIDNRYKLLDKELPTLQLWHINGSENRITSKSHLITFYELDQPTESEKNIINIHDSVMFSSSYSAKQFKSIGCNNSSNINIGFDPDFHKTNKDYLKDKIHFGLMGKFEKRKHTAKILKLWAEKYGNNYNYQLSCCINNPFVKPEQLNQLIGQALDGKQYGNINFLPFLKTNSEVNEFLNAIDIDLTGLSGAEGWNLPSFNATSLGKWSIVLNATSHKDWANKDNALLVEPSSKTLAYDGHFFQQGSLFNQGNIYEFDNDEVVSKMEEAESVCKKENKQGLKLQESYSYSNMLDNILKNIENN